MSPSDPARALQGRLLVLGAATLWGTTATLARFVFHDRAVPPLQVVELRLLISVLVLAPLLAWRRPALLRIEPRDWGYFVILGLLGVATVQATYYYTIARLGVGLAILLQYLAPSALVVFHWLRGGRVGAALVASVAAATLGTALLVAGAGNADLRGRPLDWAVGLSSAFWFAFYLVFAKRGLRRYAPPTVLLYSFAIAAAFWALLHPPWRIVGAGYPPGLWLMFLALGLFSTLIPFSLFAMGLSRLPATEAALLATFEPVVAVTSAWVFLGERLAAGQWVGAGLVLAASVSATLREAGTGPRGPNGVPGTRHGR
jgi:drug/metabolite transporter (DMT)-like permease